MSHSRSKIWARRTVGLALLALAGATGCATTEEPSVTYLGQTSLQHYEDRATDVDYPLGAEGDITPVMASESPRTIATKRKDEIWDLSLTEALHCALTNSDIIRSRVRSRGQFGSLGIASSALTNPDNMPSIYDPAIQESGVLFGGRGVEAALADFDAQLTTSMIWGRNAAYQNNAFQSGFGPGFDDGSQVGLTPAPILTQETGAFQSGLTKRLATGGSVGLYHNWNYNGNNLPSTTQLFRSAYTGSTGVNFTQPLWSGAGTEYTRIAGPLNPNFSGITGVNQGVLIARINNDITLANFEISVRTLLKDVEDVYWNLYLAYRNYDVAVIARNSALRSWREAKAILDVGGTENFRPADEAQAKDRYFETRAQVEAALNDIYINEAELRRLMGLAPNDGRVVRPIEEPTTAKLMPDWHSSLAEAMMFRTELRRQKWQIKSLQLQLTAAHSLTNPQLNLVSGYQLNAFGDNLMASSDDDGVTTQGLNDAYGSLFNGEQTGWNLGLQFNMPIGFRQAKAQVRNIELRLAKAREVLSVQELDVAHEVADAIQAVDFQYQNAATNFNRRAAAAQRVEMFEQELDAGVVTLDEVLRAQASLASAESAYYTSLVQYNQSLSYLDLVKGTLLERDNVQLEEGGWAPQAYQQALRKAWHRSHAFDNPFQTDSNEPFAIPDGSRRLVPPGPVVPADMNTPAPTGDAPQVPPAPSSDPVPEPESRESAPNEPPQPPALELPVPEEEFTNALPIPSQIQHRRQPEAEMAERLELPQRTASRVPWDADHFEKMTADTRGGVSHAEIEQVDGTAQAMALEVEGTSADGGSIEHAVHEEEAEAKPKPLAKTESSPKRKTTNKKKTTSKPPTDDE